jgi:hypothetical protein
MNARSQTFEFAVEGRQIDEVVSSMSLSIIYFLNNLFFDRHVSYNSISSLCRKGLFE